MTREFERGGGGGGGPAPDPDESRAPGETGPDPTGPSFEPRLGQTHRPPQDIERIRGGGGGPDPEPEPEPGPVSDGRDTAAPSPPRNIERIRGGGGRTPTTATQEMQDARDRIQRQQPSPEPDTTEQVQERATDAAQSQREQHTDVMDPGVLFEVDFEQPDRGGVLTSERERRTRLRIRREQAEVLDEETAANITPEDVWVESEGDSLTIGITDDATDRIAREAVEEAGINPEFVAGGQLRRGRIEPILTEEGAEALEPEPADTDQRESAARVGLGLGEGEWTVQRQLDAQTLIDIGEEDYRIDSGQAQLTDDALRREGRLRYEEVLAEEVDDGDVQLRDEHIEIVEEDGRRVPVLADGVERGVTAGLVHSETGLTPEEDFEITERIRTWDFNADTGFLDGEQPDDSILDVDLTESGEEAMLARADRTADESSSNLEGLSNMKRTASAVPGSGLVSSGAGAVKDSVLFVGQPAISGLATVEESLADTRAGSLVGQGVDAGVSGAADVLSPVVGPIRTGGGEIRDRSLSATDTVIEKGVEPAAARVGEGAELGTALLAPGESPFSDPDVVSETGIGDTTEAAVAGTGVAGAYLTVGQPAGYVDLASGVESGAQFTASQIRDDGVVMGLVGTGETSVDVATDAAAAGATAIAEDPVRTGAIASAGLTGGTVLSVGAGAIGQRAYIAGRSKLSTRGLDFDGGTVPIENLVRPDILSGQSVLTRFSEDAVPGGDRSMPVDDFPVTTARRDPAQELRNLATEFDDAQIRRGLDIGPDEYTLFSARTGTKSERFEPRSGRPYDPDAAFFAGSVSPNFLRIGTVPRAGDISGGIRRPRPVAAARSLIEAARGEIPTIVATGGRIEEMPSTVRTRGDMTDFLQAEAGSGTFYTLPWQMRSGEAEALTSAVGTGKIEPWKGAGRVGPGEATEFVEVANPLRTEVRGETVPIQMFRQDTGDITPLSQQSSEGLGLRALLSDERAEFGASPARTQATQTTSELSSWSYTPGGQPGVSPAPLAPPAVGGELSASDSDLSTAVSSPEEPVIRSNILQPTPVSTTSATEPASETESTPVSDVSLPVSDLSPAPSDVTSRTTISLFTPPDRPVGLSPTSTTQTPTPSLTPSSADTPPVGAVSVPSPPSPPVPPTVPGGGGGRGRGGRLPNYSERDREPDLGVDISPRGPAPAAPLAPGWLSETVSDIATMGRPIDDTDFGRADLEAAPFEQALVGELPTPEMALGDDDVQERIRDVQDLFGQPTGYLEDGEDEFFEVGFGFDDGDDDSGQQEAFADFDVGLDFGDDEGGGFL